MEGLLLHLLVGLLIFGLIFFLIRIILPNLGSPAWVVQVALAVVGVCFVIWLIYLLIPLLHTRAM